MITLRVSGKNIFHIRLDPALAAPCDFRKRPRLSPAANESSPARPRRVAAPRCARRRRAHPAHREIAPEPSITGSTSISSSFVLKLDLKARGEALASKRPAIDKADIGAALRFIHVMRGDENRDAAVAQIVEQIPHLLAMHRIEARRRFIQKKQRRLVHQRARDRQQLPHAAR